MLKSQQQEISETLRVAKSKQMLWTIHIQREKLTTTMRNKTVNELCEMLVVIKIIWQIKIKLWSCGTVSMKVVALKGLQCRMLVIPLAKSQWIGINREKWNN